MKVLLYICYWPLHDGLTQSTVLPNLQLLAGSTVWDKVIFTTVENAPIKPAVLHSKINHHPFSSPAGSFVLLNRFLRWKRYKQFLKNLINDNKVTCILGRGAPAGILACELSQDFKIPYYVESFEPHSAYMQESGVWKKWDPRYIKQKLGERKVKKTAKGLITVSNNYRRQLEHENVDPGKIQVVPCVVNTQLFTINEHEGNVTRQKLGIPANAVVGINVGKYGGIYHDEKAFLLFKYLFQHIPGYYQIFLTHDTEDVHLKAAGYGLPKKLCIIANAMHHEVPAYLSAADFGFVLVKSTPSKKFCSAIKTGEYWASGLPVIITEDIGDESEIISATETGIVWNATIDSLPELVQKLESVLANSFVKEKNRQLAIQYRNNELIGKAYSGFNLI